MPYDQIIIGFLIILAAIISIEFGISVAILEIIAGIIAFNLLSLDSLPWIDFLANLGLLGIMFFAGFEIDPPILIKHLKKSIVIGFASYFGAFFSVFLFSNYILSLSLKTSLLVAIGLSTTSLVVVYTILRGDVSLSKDIAQVVLASAMVVDILSMLSLSILFEGITLSSVLVLVLFLILSYFLPKIGKWIFSRYKSNTIEFKIRFIFLVLLGLFLVSEKVGVHVAVFAFLLGILMSELLEEHKILESKLRGIIFGFMSPLFFFKAGQAMDLSLLSIDAIKIIFSLGAIAIVSKYLSTFFAAKRYYKGTVPKLFGIIFNVRLSFGVIVATFGLTSNLISQTLYTAMLTIIIFSSILVSFILKIIPHEN